MFLHVGSLGVQPDVCIDTTYIDLKDSKRKKGKKENTVVLVYESRSLFWLWN
jgi:hypothetical protein